MNIKHKGVPLTVEYDYDSEDKSTGYAERLEVHTVYFDDTDVTEIYAANGIIEELDIIALKEKKEIENDQYVSNARCS